MQFPYSQKDFRGAKYSWKFTVLPENTQNFKNIRHLTWGRLRTGHFELYEIR